MYYKNVNRGLSFTKPGRYAILFVMGIGLVAVNTGTNGMYLFLALGLALVVVSGLLSESAMRHVTVKQFSTSTIEAGESFSLPVFVHNFHKQVSLYGIELDIHIDKPDFRFLREPPKAIAHGSILALPSYTTVACSCSSSGLKRGYHNGLWLVVKTNFPFGFITKYKVTHVEGRLIVTPNVLPMEQKELAKKLTENLRGQNDENEFDGHQPFNSNRTVKLIDWKKSAGRPPEQWMIKTFSSEIAATALLIRPKWDSLDSLPAHISGQSDFEYALSLMQTAVKVATTSHLEVALELQPRQYVVGHEDIARTLAFLEQKSLPTSSEFALPAEVRTRSEIPATPLILTLNGKDWQFLSGQMQRGAG